MKVVIRGKSNVHLRKVLDYLLVYLLALGTCGFYFHSTGAAYYAPVAVTLAFALIKKVRIRRKILLLGIAMCINVMISSIVAGDELTSIIQIWVAIITGIVITSAVSKQSFLDVYCKLMYWLCLGSTIVYLFTLIFPNFISIFPRVYEGNIGEYFTGFSFVRLATQWVAMRNQSIFWEPGCFQTFIILAFLFEISKYGEKSRKKIYVYILATITTMSTTGMVALFLAIIIWLIESNNKTKLKGIRFLISALTVLVVVISVFQLLPQGLSNRTFDKVSAILNGDMSNISVSTRMNAVFYSLQSALKSPLIGVGRSGLTALGNYNEAGLSIMTFTPGNWMGRYGILFGIIAVIGFLQVRDNLFETRNAKVISIVLLIVVIATEAYTTNALIWVFVFYGFANKRLDKQIKDEAEGEL